MSMVSDADQSIGDTIELTMSDGLLKSYEISALEITDKPELRISKSMFNSDNIILTTCWPFNSSIQSSQRYILIATRKDKMI